MKIVISPAKSLNFEQKIPFEGYSDAQFLENASKIQGVLKEKTPQELMDLMKISQNLADLNWSRNQNWTLPFTIKNARQAVFAFDGDVYSGLDVYSLSNDQVKLLQKKLRILSGLYGILKPLDLIQPYRLEMGTKLAIGKHQNLHNFWKETVTDYLNKELNDSELFINLASAEYFAAIDPKKLKTNIITPEFKDYKNGNLKIISFFAKKARGLMVRYIIDNQVETLEELKKFNSEGYAFDANLSSESQLIFTR